MIWSVWLNGWVSVYNLSGSGFESSWGHLYITLHACFEQGVSWHSSNYRVWIQSEHVPDMIRTSDKYSEHSSVIRSVQPNGWVLVSELIGSGFGWSCSHLSFTLRTCSEQGVPRHLGNYRVYIHSETRLWHNKNILSIELYRWIIRTQLIHLVSLAKWLSILLWTKWFLVQVQLQSLKLHIARLLQAKSSLTFRQLYGVVSLRKAYVTL